MTPGINAAKKAGIAFTIHEYAHEAGAPSYGLEAAEKLGLLPEKVFKTLVTQLDHKQLVVAIVPVHCTLDLKALAAACQGNKAENRAGCLCLDARNHLCERWSAWAGNCAVTAGLAPALRWHHR